MNYVIYQRSIVDEIIPTIEHRLTVSNEKYRRDAAKINCLCYKFTQ